MGGGTGAGYGAGAGYVIWQTGGYGTDGDMEHADIPQGEVQGYIEPEYAQAGG